jgi:AraC family transcriptional regulator
MLISEMEIYRDFAGQADSLLLGQLHQVLVRHLLRWHSTAPRSTLRALDGTEHAPLASAPLRQVIDYINANYAEDIGLAELAALACQSEDHFIRGFRAATGITPYRYLLRVRLRRACALLRDSELAIGEIASATGFRGAAYFSTRFRHYVGVSPSRYRNSFSTYRRPL